MTKEYDEDHFQRLQIPFSLDTSFAPAGDQPIAIQKLVSNLQKGIRYQTLMGVTGSGKTFTMANVIATEKRPALVIAPNKTLAAQLYAEFKEFFPNNRVRYFVSYYDYYQPEAYVPSTDTYIEKDSAINEEIDKMRHSATRALLEATDTIVVASVSCIYGLGAPQDYFGMMFFVEEGDSIPREEVINKLVYMQYTRSDFDFERGTFRVRGEILDIFPSDENARAIRLIFLGDEIEEIREIDSVSGSSIRRLDKCAVYPVSHFVTDRDTIRRATKSIEKELGEQLSALQRAGKLLEAQRLEQRTRYDMEILEEIGICSGIENYSRHLDGRAPGTPPSTLLDYFPRNFLLIIDESHVTIPQIGGMYRGDRSRKETLVEYGFRLPSAIDNRPLNFEEFWSKIGQVVFVSATPGNFEIEKSGEHVVEQINRPTGLLDPQVIIRPALNQVDDLLSEIRSTIDKGSRVLAITLTKKMAEDLSGYMRELGIKSRYLHSDITTIERVEILRGLRKGDFDVLIGINLLREGLDLVEVSLVAVLDADKEGFLRSTRSLIQVMGRAARNIDGRVILYADMITESMRGALDETERRRKIQAEFNKRHNITPRSARSQIQESLGNTYEDEALPVLPTMGLPTQLPREKAKQEELLTSLRKEMFDAAAKREFERAAQLRDAINAIQEELLKL